MKKNLIRAFVGGITLLSTFDAMAQLSVSIDVVLGSCLKPILTAKPVGGSGNYKYAWGVNGSTCPIQSNYGEQVLSPDLCNSAATFYVFVRDLTTGQNQYAEVNVPKSFPFGDFNADLPNVFTPNGDGANDTFSLCTAVSLGSGPTNVWRASIVVNNRWGAKVYENNYASLYGMTAPFTLWDGGSNSAGTYFVTVNLMNCTNTKELKVQLNLLK